MLKFLAQLNAAPVEYTIGVGGGHGAFKAKTVPHAWLVNTEGTIVWAGNPGSLSEKIIEAELKKVVKPNEEARAARLEKATRYADDLAKDGRVLAAVSLLERLLPEAVKGTPAAAALDAKIQEIGSSEEAKAELAAQLQIAKIIGGVEKPEGRMKSQERDSAAKRLKALIAANGEKAPRSAAEAKLWLRVVTEDWTAGK